MIVPIDLTSLEKDHPTWSVKAFPLGGDVLKSVTNRKIIIYQQVRNRRDISDLDKEYLQKKLKLTSYLMMRD